MCPPPYKESTSDSSPNYNEVLLQISTNLSNTLRTFGPSSQQYQVVLQTLKDCLQEIDNHDAKARMHVSGAANDASNRLELDPDMLSRGWKDILINSSQRLFCDFWASPVSAGHPHSANKQTSGAWTAARSTATDLCCGSLAVTLLTPLCDPFARISILFHPESSRDNPHQLQIDWEPQQLRHRTGSWSWMLDDQR
ncbi:conserved hypothetical protein [Paecilomyces variotii No. 5]|uniref:Uncharacterized protein n=1 Tax=Byssochlamys spectabilis (strain No. 5 / NBRC 109023) TaxID=1356009 RepID=V5HZ02_BYSSN|nr:conserved hypothetical protein [Paecilomyces variotii No. 5]